MTWYMMFQNSNFRLFPRPTSSSELETNSTHSKLSTFIASQSVNRESIQGEMFLRTWNEDAELHIKFCAVCFNSFYGISSPTKQGKICKHKMFSRPHTEVSRSRVKTLLCAGTQVHILACLEEIPSAQVTGHLWDNPWRHKKAKKKHSRVMHTNCI